MLRRIFIAATYCICSASVGWPALLTPDATVPIPRDFTAQRLPHFQNGFILANDFDHAKVWSYDRSGKVLMEVQLAISGVTQIKIRNIGAAADGTVAVSASASDNEGRLASIIIWISSAGTIARVVRTEPFSASQIAFAADGSLWAAGRAYSFNPANPPAAQFQTLGQYDVLRHFDAQGRVIATALPRASFDASSKDPAMEGFLAVLQDRVGFLSVTAKEYVELSLAGQTIGRWGIHTPLPSNTAVGFAVTPSGGVFLSMRPQVDANAPYQGPPLYQFDKATGTLEPIQFPVTGPMKPSVLLGNDVDRLVFYSKPPSVTWFDVK